MSNIPIVERDAKARHAEKKGKMEDSFIVTGKREGRHYKWENFLTRKDEYWLSVPYGGDEGLIPGFTGVRQGGGVVFWREVWGCHTLEK